MNSIKKLFNSSKYLKELFQSSNGFRIPILVIIFLNILFHVMGVATPLLTKFIIDSAIYKELDNFKLYLFSFGLLMIMTLIMQSFIKYYTSKFTEKMRNHLQKNFMNNLFNLNFNNYSQYHTGDIMTRVTRDINGILSFYSVILPSIFALIIQLFFSMIIILKYDAVLGLYALIIAPFIAIISLLFGKKIKPLQNKINTFEGSYRSTLNEMIQNLTIIKSFEYEDIASVKIDQQQQNRLQLIVNKLKTIVLINGLIDFFYALSSFVVLGLGAYRISQGFITFGMYTAIVQLVAKIRYPVMELTKLIPQYVSILSSLDRCEPFFKEKTIKDNIISTEENLGLKIDSLSFGYTSDKFIFKDLNINVKPNEKIALIGASGIGKSTLMKLILNLLTPQNGLITLYNSKEYENSIHHYTYVPQGNTLFSGSIVENLRVGNPNANIDEMNLALKHACADDFVNNLPLGINTILGENGFGFSEGQIQRICIARALLHSRPIILLDEATSALDQLTEEKLLKNIYENYPNKTLIAITHKVSVLHFIDHIINLETITQIDSK